MNRFTTVLLICLASLLSFASNSHKEVVIKGKVLGFSDKSAQIITAIDCNPWSHGSLRHAVKIDSSGNFRTFVNIPFGHNFTIYYDRTYFCQYAEPGDSIYMVIDTNNLKSGANYSGTRGKFNNEYGKAYAKLFNTFFADVPPSGQMNKDEYLEFFKKIHFKNLENISHYADSVGMGDDSRDLLVQSALFSLANSALDHEDETPEKVLSFFNESIFGLDDEDNLKEMMFPTHLKAYLWRLKDVVKPDSIIQMVEAIQSRHPKSLNRDIMLAICLKDMIWDCELPDLNRDLFYNEEIYDLIYRQSDKEEALPEITDAQGSIYEWNNGKAIASEYSNISELLAKEYAGKIVYLDLWATWCGPCLIANQSLSEVANFFKEDDIVFVSVAMRSDFEKWKKHASERPANCKDYFIKNEDDTALIMSGYKMNGFPAFRIIGRDSKIINSNPPRPNSPIIYDTLSEILK